MNMQSSWISLILLLGIAGRLNAQAIVNGQIFTPGIAIIDSPQPNTPEGGDFLQVALDISSDGQLSLPPYPDNSSSKINNITIFLSSYVTGNNFTITNGTATANNASLGDILFQEPGSTVKHVNWVWPDCLVGNGGVGANSSRGPYNISIHQNFRLNGTDLYTIFDLPIEVTNSIPASDTRPSCAGLNNSLLTQDELEASANNFTRIAGTGIQSGGSGDSDKGNAAGLTGMTAGSWTTLWFCAVIASSLFVL
ncbi:hypothetical protein B7463_g5015, partial [Scytalidium lignicola]